MRVHAAVTLAAAIGLAACAPTYPETGQPSEFDGLWAGSLTSMSAPCVESKMTAEGDIRYGFVIGEVKEIAASRIIRYQIWGQIGADKRLNASIGIAGVAGASADILFDGNDARGTWKSSDCDGDVTLRRVQ
ncbi:MAG: hypothetical protein MI741_09140 [Rhodospirillales bacterium]|nr:hypothetical protein [Rhodospirillales bacterium]